MGDAEKTTNRRQNMHKTGVRYDGCSDGDTPAPPPPMSLLYTVTTRGGEAFLRGGV
jgi:hypothetical protein